MTATPVSTPPASDSVNRSVVAAILNLRNLKQEDIAPVIGATPSTVSRRLKYGNWSATEIKRLSLFLGVPLDVFYLPSEVAFARLTNAEGRTPDGDPATSPSMCAPWDLNPEPADYPSAHNVVPFLNPLAA